jgi:hypothetical protein
MFNENMDAQAVSAERKKSHRQGKHGIIVASFGKISDKRKEMEKKSQLKDSRNYKDIFIEHSIPKNQRMLNSSLRNLSVTYNFRLNNCTFNFKFVITNCLNKIP